MVGAYADHLRMLDEQKPEAVSVVVPTADHHGVALQVIQRGIHLLIEKPLAFTIQEGQEIIEAAASHGVKLMVGHIERFNPAVIALREHLSSGELGRAFQIDAHRQGPFPARVRDVGVVIDLAVHDLDIMRYVTGSEIVRVYAETQRRIHTEREDLLSGMVRFADDTVGTLTTNWLTPTKIREVYVTGERGMFRVDYLTQDLYFYENAVANGGDWATIQVLRGVSEGPMIRYAIAKKEPLRSELESFLAAVQEKASVTVTGQDGLKAIELAQALVTSGLDHRVVFI
jgi:predicted dehydrogenase